MAEAYVLAQELQRAANNLPAAFARYESLLQPFLKTKQQAAIGFATFFAPPNAATLFFRNLVMRAASFPPLAHLLIGRAIRDDFQLPK